ncbi:hypothetical protein FRC02_005870 [Tulasnella sp. 418]|nr:hypothetical protein FRC02_005870 [Tulasnella sp. 418]
MTYVTIGVLALQGGFAEHLAALSKLDCNPLVDLRATPVKTAEDLAQCDALIIPGGESTTIALLARLAGLLDPLREFISQKPVWGTCAGAILLSKEVIGVKKGGQEVFGVIDVKIARNGWGSQLESFEQDLIVEGMTDPGRPFKGVFIRAPVVLEILSPSNSDCSVRVISKLPQGGEMTKNRAAMANRGSSSALLTPPNELEDTEASIDVVALQQGRYLLTTFHPELTEDARFHELFVREFVLSNLKE